MSKKITLENERRLLTVAHDYNLSVKALNLLAQNHGIRFAFRAISFSTEPNKKETRSGKDLEFPSKFIKKIEKLTNEKQCAEKIKFRDNLKTIGFELHEWTEDYVDEDTGNVMGRPRYYFKILKKWAPSD